MTQTETEMDGGSHQLHGFPSLASMRLEHNALLKHHRAQGNAAGVLAEIEAFIQRGRASGVVLDAESDRSAVQSVLDYWATVVLSITHVPVDATLEEFDVRLAPELDDQQCPYLGLDAFRESNHAIYFGRQRLMHEIVERFQHNRLLIITGPSGSGKSSLLRAGVVPVLKAGALPTSQSWHYYPPVVPGSDPLLSLVRLFQPNDIYPSGWIDEQVQRLLQDRSHLLKLVRADAPGSTVMLIDQFEEIFTLCNNEQVRAAFAENLLVLTQSTEPQHRVLLTIRSDFESYLMRLPAFPRLPEQSQIRITPLNASELREAIEKPAELAGLKFEEGVVDALLRDLLGEPAALPLLQFTLLKLWENRQRNRVPWEAYRRLGGGRLALARSANELYERLIPEEQLTAKRILLRLVQAGEGVEVTGKRIRRDTLYHAGEARDRIDRVLEKLVRARLVRISEAEHVADAQLEIAHEALVRNWPRLVEWLQEEHERITLRQRLESRAAEWVRLGRGQGGLLDEIALIEAEHWLTGPDANDLGYTEDVATFVQASRAALEQARSEKEDALQRELVQLQVLASEQQRRAEAERPRATIRQRANHILGVLLVVVLVATGIVAVQQRQLQAANQNLAIAVAEKEAQHTAAEAAASEAQHQRTVAEAAAAEAQHERQLALSRQLAAQALTHLDYLDLALLLSVEASRIVDAGEARNSLLATLQSNPRLLTFFHGHTGSVLSVAVSPDGKLLATTGADQTIRLWDLVTGKPVGQPLTGHTNAITGVAFSPDGTSLVSASLDGSLLRWDLAHPGEHLRLTAGTPGPIHAIAVSPDRHTIATGNEARQVILWDLSTPSPVASVFQSQTSAVLSLAFSPDGKMLASGSRAGTILLWNTVTRQQSVPPFVKHTGSVDSLAFSPDGKLLASGGADGNVILWDRATAKPLFEPNRMHTGEVHSVAFSPSGNVLASASADRSILLWDVATGKSMGQPLTGHIGGIYSLAFVDEQRLVSGSEDKRAILWNIAATQRLGQVYADHTAEVRNVAFSPDGTLLASGSADGSIILRDIATAKIVQRFTTGYTGEFVGLSFDPGGNLLATCNGISGDIDLWDVATGQRIGQPLKGHTAGVISVAFSPDGKLLASGSADQHVLIWDVAKRTPTHALLRGHSGTVFSVAFSPDGKLLASGSADGRIILWDVSTGQPVLPPLTGHANGIYSVAFSPDGTLLASGSADSRIILWDTRSGKPVGQPLMGHTSPVRSVAFSADGKTLASGSADRSVMV